MKAILHDKSLQPDLMITISAVLVTGGVTTELYQPGSRTTCRLPTRSNLRSYHTIEDGGLMCGGYYTPRTCVRWNSVNGTWEEYLRLNIRRSYHVSWTPDPSIGTYLMGGGKSIGGKGSSNSSTLIKPDGSQEPGFRFKYNIMYVYVLKNIWGKVGNFYFI